MANLKITQTRSTIGCPQTQRETLRGLGIRRMHHTVIRPDEPAIRGMIFKVKHLVQVEETDEAVTLSRRQTDRKTA